MTTSFTADLVRWLHVLTTMGLHRGILQHTILFR